MSKGGKPTEDEVLVSLNLAVQKAINNSTFNQHSSSQSSQSSSQQQTGLGEARTALLQFVKKADFDGLVKCLASRTKTPGKDPIELIRALFSACGLKEFERGESLRRVVVSKIIKLLEKGDLKERTASNVISLVLPELDRLPIESSMVSLVNQILEGLRTSLNFGARTIELLPKFLEHISTLASLDSNLNSNGDFLSESISGTRISGMEFKKGAVQAICNFEWPSNVVVNLTTIFRDMPLSNEELCLVSDTVMKHLPNLDTQELPPLVYQLLLLSTKGHKSTILKGVVEYFNRLHASVTESEDLEEGIAANEHLRAVEANVLMHINFAAKQDQDLVKEFMKMLTSQHLPLTPFFLALLFSISRIQRFEEQVYDFLKTTIFGSFNTERRLYQNGWLEEVQKIAAFKEIHQSSEELKNAIIEMVRHTLNGWDQIVPSLVQFGVFLMDYASQKLVTIHSDSETPVFQNMVKLAIDLLTEIFKLHESVRNEIIEQIFSRVLTKAENVNQFVDLLANLLSENSAHVLEPCISRIKEAIDYLSLLPSQTSKRLLVAVSNLMRTNHSFQDHVVLVLRKSMFSREASGRITAVVGFLQLLKGASNPMAQSSQSSQSSNRVWGDRDRLRGEILNFLRRCLSQQASVREVLYQGLVELFQSDEMLQGLIFEFLTPHLEKYLHLQREDNPVRLEDCIDDKSPNIRLIEPVGKLVHCLQKCVIHYEDCLLNTAEMDIGAYKETKSLLEALVLRFREADWNIERDADFSTSRDGLVHREGVTILLHYAEGLFEFCLMRKNLAFTRKGLEVFDSYSQLVDCTLTALANSTKGGKKGSGGNEKSSFKMDPILSIDAIVWLMGVFEGKEEGEHVRLLITNVGLFQHVLNACLHQLTQFHKSLRDLDWDQKACALKFCGQVAPLLVGQVLEQKGDKEKEKETVTRGKAISLLAMECLQTVLLIASSHSVAKVATVLEGAKQLAEKSEKVPRTDYRAKIEKHVRVFCDQLKFVVDNESWKEAKELLEILGVLWPCIPTKFVTEHCSWIEGFLEVSLDNLVFVKQLTIQYLQLSRTLNNNKFYNFCQEFRLFAGTSDIRHSDAPSTQRKFGIINKKTAAQTLLTIVTSGLTPSIEELEWVAASTKAILAATRKTPQQSKAEEVISVIHTRINNMILMVSAIADSKVPVGLGVDSLLRFLMRFYKLLVTTVKLNTGLGHAVKGLRNWVDEANELLTSKVNQLLSYLEANKESTNKVKIKKEIKLKPMLVYEMERLEYSLISLNKEIGGAFLSKMRRTQARDFVLNKKVMEAELAALEDQDNLRDEEGGDNDGQLSPPKKRKRAAPAKRKQKKNGVGSDGEAEEEEEELQGEDGRSEDDAPKKRSKKATNNSAGTSKGHRKWGARNYYSKGKK